MVALPGRAGQRPLHHLPISHLLIDCCPVWFTHNQTINNLCLVLEKLAGKTLREDGEEDSGL